MKKAREACLCQCLVASMACQWGLFVICRGLLLERMGQPDQALPNLDAACRLDSTNAEHFRTRGMAHRTAGRLQPALADFERVLALAPDDPAALSNRGCRCCALLGILQTMQVLLVIP